MKDKIELAQSIQIPGIDMQSVIIHLGDDLNLFQELVQIYYKETSRLVSDLEKCLAQDINLFRIHVHSIKGSTASIGGKDIANKAAILEVAARNKDIVSIEDMLPIFIMDINNLLKNIKVYLNHYIKEQELKEKVVVDCIDWEALIALKKGFEQFNMGCIEVSMEKLKRYEYVTPLQGFINDIEKCVEELEYERGSRLIAEYLAR